MPKYLTIPPLTVDILTRFWQKVNQQNNKSCWFWMARCSKGGYGIFRIGHKMYYASRIALATAGKYNNELEVCHTCNNSSCVNPRHLRFGTHIENINDRTRAKTGFCPQGSKNGSAKLKESDIPIIRQLVQIKSQQEVGNLFGVSRQLINNIVLGKQWSHVC